MSEQLKQTSAQIEGAVLEVCLSFQGIAQQAKATVARGQSFLSQGGDSADASFDTVLRRCGDTLLKVLSVTEESGEVSRRAIERIRQMDAAASKITTALDQLDQISLGNRIMALNARIEAAHAGEKGAGFAVVATEVSAQAEKSREITSRVCDVVAELRQLAASTLDDLEKMLARDVARMRQCRQEVDRSLAELKAAHAAMTEVLSGMSEDGAQLAAEIGTAIRGMQFQDRVAQRIAHVVEDLETLQNRLSASSSGEEISTAGFDGFSVYTMVEERVVAGMGADESGAGDVELF